MTNNILQLVPFTFVLVVATTVSLFWPSFPWAWSMWGYLVGSVAAIVLQRVLRRS